MQKTKVSTRDKDNGLGRIVQCVESLGFPIVKQGKRLYTNLRGERTASVVLNPDGSFYDFGSGEYGTCVDLLMRFKGLSESEAFREYAEVYLGQSFSIEDYQDVSNNEHSSWAEKKSQKKDFRQKVGFFRNLAKKPENHNQFLEMLGELLPSVSERNKLLEIAEEFEIGYRSSPIPMLVMPIKDMTGKIVNLWKYNKKSEVKVVFESGCSETAFPLNKIEKYASNKDKVIVICEGQKDVLNAIANGYEAITSGSSVSIFSDEVLEKLRDKKVAIYGDYDEAGEHFSKNIKNQFKAYTSKDIYVFDWNSAFKRYGVKKPKKGFDLTDLLELKRIKDERDKN